MAATKRFRTAINGFNREDVVEYIEFLNNQHKNQIEQLNNQLQQAQSIVPAVPSPQEKLAEAEQRCITLQQQLEEAMQKCSMMEEKLAAQPVPQPAQDTTEELEAYRRAERAERMAQERAQQIYKQANAVLADASQKAEAAAAHIGQISDRAAVCLKECQDSVASTKNTFQDAAAALYAIRPESDDQ